MHEGPPPEPLIRDRRPDTVGSIDEQHEVAAKLLERADAELEILAPTLRELIHVIEEQRPERVVFLDKGARMFALPIRKYLQESQIKPVPDFAFYNDQHLKGSYLEKEEDMDTVIRDELGELQGKKVLFIDESFSNGKGAVPLRHAMDILQMDASYFALSYDPHPQNMSHTWRRGYFHEVDYKEHFDNLAEVRSDPRFIISQNALDTVFTKEAAKLYVTETDLKTEKRYEMIPEGEEEREYDYSPKKGELPNARTYADPPKGMSWQEYDQEARKLNYATVRALSDKIYDKLVSSNKE